MYAQRHNYLKDYYLKDIINTIVNYSLSCR